VKVLIAAPISGHKQYSINQWFDWIANQRHTNYEFALCVNGENQAKLVSMLKKVSVQDVHEQIKKPVILWNTNKKGIKTTFLHNIVHARETLRQYAIDNGFDKIFWLDTDTIPKNLQSIEILAKSNLDAISGLYFYKKTTKPVAVSKSTGTNFTIKEIEDAINDRKLLEAGLFGLGCALIDRKVFLKVPFEYSEFGTEVSDDYGFCYAMDKLKIPRYVNPAIFCYHLGKAQDNIAFQIKTD